MLNNNSDLAIMVNILKFVFDGFFFFNYLVYFFSSNYLDTLGTCNFRDRIVSFSDIY